MSYINISHWRSCKGEIYESSGESERDFSVNNILKEDGFWRTKQRDIQAPDFFIIDMEEVVPVNYIEILTSKNGKKTFPAAFRIEGSREGKYWNILHSEDDLDIGDATSFYINLPITPLRYLKFFITGHQYTGERYYSEIGRFSTGISGIKSVRTSSSAREDMPKKLFDNRSETFWETKTHSKPGKESVDVDLGAVYHINRVALASANISPHAFPENFSVESSTDRQIWTPLVEEKKFTAEPAKIYCWNISTQSARYVRILMRGTAIENKAYACRLAEIEIFAAGLNTFHSHNIGEITPHASIFQAGIVRLSKDGEALSGTAVQGSDTRLREASTLFSGIVRLSEDGEAAEGTAVQASDSRLKNASEISPGVVRLAKDMETAPGIAVQGNDSRLMEAGEDKPGIVKLCRDGAGSELGVVRGSDSRLKKATTSAFGITRLAENGENSADCVVQGNDSRLREGTTTYKGIVELAEDGEAKEGVVVQGHDKRLKDATTSAKGIVELAEDGETKKGVVVQGHDKRLKDATTSAKGIVELAEDGEDKPGVVVQGNDRRLRDATESIKGIMKFAGDGSMEPLAAVQGNDKRLKDATTTAKGIVELAEDGEDIEGVVVQGHDKRLKNATTTAKGIVELAEDGEDTEGVVVQGHDKRLKDATTTAKGIVELAEDGEDKPGVVVQGNDRRLKDASLSIKGIMKFAEDGSPEPLAAVQGNDRRLREATTTYKGIVELAEDGEAKEGVAVQGNDKRLRDATTTTKGIVELAEDGESIRGVAVQGDDRRLKDASEKSPGIVRLAKDGEHRNGCAVQADDSRLSDARPPLPHSHEYAPIVHEFNSHSGTLKITGKKDEKFTGIVPPGDDSAVIYAKNESSHEGSVGITGISNPLNEGGKYTYGVVGHSRFTGVRGQSNGDNTENSRGCGVLGISRFGAGGFFASEHSYSLVADGYGGIKKYDDSINIKGNGQALFVNGSSEFNGKISLTNRAGDEKAPANITEMFVVDEEEYITAGDLLIASERGNSILKRSDGKYSKGVIGIVSGNPAFVINNSGERQKIYPVVLTGKTLCRIDARARAVKPGDLIVTSDTPGCGMAGEMDSPDKIGTVIGKALDSISGTIGIIPVFIARG